MTLLFVLLLCVISIGLFVALATLPRWSTRSCHQFRIWKLRDDLADNILSGALPKENEAVCELLEELDTMARDEKTITLLNFGLWILAKRSVSKDLGRLTSWPPAEDLSPEQTKVLFGYREQLDVLLAGSILTSSWIGLGLISYYFVQLKVHVSRKTSSGVPAFGQATDIAAKKARLVQLGAPDIFMLQA